MLMNRTIVRPKNRTGFKGGVRQQETFRGFTWYGSATDKSEPSGGFEGGWGRKEVGESKMHPQLKGLGCAIVVQRLICFLIELRKHISKLCIMRIGTLLAPPNSNTVYAFSHPFGDVETAILSPPTTKNTTGTGRNGNNRISLHLIKWL